VLRVAGAASSLSAIVIDGAGERTVFSHRPGGLADARVTDPDAVLDGIDAVLVDNRFPEMVLPLMQAARARGLPVVLDGDRPTRETAALIALATHAVFAEDGLSATTGTGDVAEGLAQAAGMTAGLVAVTLGGRGVVWRDGDALHRLPAFAVEVVDTLGAGDVFHGAFALAVAEGQGVADATRFASAAAALKCTGFGGRLATPTRAAVEALLVRG
jgi:sulfofructose kinase